MSYADTITVDPAIRETLEQAGIVIPKLPSLDHLMKKIRDRHGSVAVALDGNGATAQVSLGNGAHDGAGTEPAVAVARALAAALQAEPQQMQFWDVNARVVEEEPVALVDGA